MKIGIISDTHGKIPAEVFNAFESVDQIWHAGDIGSSDIITELETIAPVIAVRGNVDGFPASMKLPLFESIEINQSHFLLTHRFLDHQMRPFHGIDLSIAYNCKAVIYGHTHEASVLNFKSITLVNPGSLLTQFKPVLIDLATRDYSFVKY